jgi:hypothetical protein
MLQLGSQNFLDQMKLDMGFFTGNRSFIGVDMADLEDLYEE